LTCHPAASLSSFLDSCQGRVMVLKITSHIALPLLLLTAFSSQAVEIVNKDGNRLFLNGRVNVSRYMTENTSLAGDVSWARFGLTGDTRITESLTGFGSWQQQFNLKYPEGTGCGERTRLGYAGIKHTDWGSIDYGRNYGVIFDALSFTDRLPKSGADSAYFDTFMSSRITGALTYRQSDFFNLIKGLNIALQYQGKHDRDNIRYANGEGYGIATTYKMDNGLGWALTIASHKRTALQNASPYGKGKRADTWALAMQYDANNIYLAALYGERHRSAPIVVPVEDKKIAGFANDSRNLELVAQYQFDNGFRPSLGYVSSKAKHIEGIGDADLFNYLSVGYFYYFNANMNTYADYKVNFIKKDHPLAVASEDIFAVGLNFQF